MIEQPFHREFSGVSKHIHGGLTYVKNRRVQLFELRRTECIAVLLRVELGVI